MDIDDAELDRMQSAYKATVETWIAAIRAEEALASVNHSVAEIDLWENAHFLAEHARGKADAAVGIRGRAAVTILRHRLTLGRRGERRHAAGRSFSTNMTAVGLGRGIPWISLSNPGNRLAACSNTVR